MIAPLRELVCVIAAMALAVTAGASAPAAAVPMPKPRPAASDKAKITTDTKVYLLRGLLNIFSLGMDALSDKLNAMGIKAEVFNHDSWPSVAVENRRPTTRTDKQGAVVLIGHSLGADVVFYADRAARSPRIFRCASLCRSIRPARTKCRRMSITCSISISSTALAAASARRQGIPRRARQHGSEQGRELRPRLDRQVREAARAGDREDQEGRARPGGEEAAGAREAKAGGGARNAKETSQETPKELPAIPFIVPPQTTQ